MVEAEFKGHVESSELSAVIIRADGTREDLGVISAYNRDPEKNRVMRQEIEQRARARVGLTYYYTDLVKRKLRRLFR